MAAQANVRQHGHNKTGNRISSRPSSVHEFSICYVTTYSENVFPSPSVRVYFFHISQKTHQDVFFFSNFDFLSSFFVAIIQNANESREMKRKPQRELDFCFVFLANFWKNVSCTEVLVFSGICAYFII